MLRIRYLFPDLPGAGTVPVFWLSSFPGLQPPLTVFLIYSVMIRTGLIVPARRYTVTPR
jgi:hypothetical protein